MVLALVLACSGNNDADTPPADTGSRATFYGADPGDQAAAFVSGDFNGDGTVDVALGATNADGPNNDAPDTGEVLIFHGPFAAGETYDASDAAAVLYGTGQGVNFGRSLTAGDLDGDDADDLAIASPLTADSTGEIEVLFATGETATLLGAEPGDYAGLRMATAKLDGEVHLIIGALEGDGPDNDRETAGELYLIPGSDITPGSTIQLAETSNVIYGADANDHLGEAFTTGDVNGDGSLDLIIVATFASGPDNSRESAGETYVFFSPVALPLDLATDEPDITILGTDEGDQLGHAIAAGDWNGDGAGDIMLGAVSADGPDNAVDLAGEVVFVEGTSRGIVDSAGGELAIVRGPEPKSRLGRYATAGDLNADGLADFIVSAPDLAARAGLVYVFNGGDSFPSSIEGAGPVLQGYDAGDVLGTEVFGASPFSVADVDGDGRFELLISAPQADGPDNARTDAGEAYIIFFES